MAKSFACSLVTPEAAVLDTEAHYADLPAHDGQLGILPDRAAMLIQLGVGRCTIRTADHATRRFVLDGGFAQMLDNKLTLLCAGAIDAEHITREQAREALAAAGRLPMHSIDQVDRRNHDLAVARAMAAAAG
jgi:F-type H+-transporting ATPase subunit epsilon